MANTMANERQTGMPHNPFEMAPQTSKLVLFDFDGTLTTRDTLIEFVKFYRGTAKYLWGMLLLSPMLALLKLKVIPNWKAKQFFLANFFKGERLQDFDARCIDFSTQVLPHLIRPKALEAIQEYQKQNTTMVVVSASAENWIKPWCDKHGIRCLATRLEVKDGLLTGNIKGRNCHGDEKVCRIKETFDTADYDEILAFGDSSGDKEMLALAHRSHYKPFR